MPKKNKPETKTAASPVKTAPKAAATELQVFIDYPQQDEGVASEHYAVRIGTTPAAEKVEVAIDRGPWLAARASQGYWWFDWTNFTPGVHRLTARALTADGTSGVSPQRRVQVLKK